MRRIRLSLRWMMVGVAIVAIAFLGARWYWTYRTWTWWLTRVNVNPMDHCGLNGETSYYSVKELGRPIPVKVTYSYQFNKTKPLPGMSFLIWGEIRVVDLDTKLIVDVYSFDVTLQPGVRESASGSFTYEAIVTRPGRYQVWCELQYRDPLGNWRETGGSSAGLFDIATPTQPSQGVE